MEVLWTMSLPVAPRGGVAVLTARCGRRASAGGSPWTGLGRPCAQRRTMAVVLPPRSGGVDRGYPFVLMAYATRSIVLPASRCQRPGPVRAGCLLSSLCLVHCERIGTAALQRVTDLIDFYRCDVETSKLALPPALSSLHCCCSPRSRAATRAKPHASAARVCCTAPQCCPGARCSPRAHPCIRATFSRVGSPTSVTAAPKSASARRSAAPSSARPRAWATTRACGGSIGKRGSARRRASSRRRRSCAPCDA